LQQQGLVEELFEQFDTYLQGVGYAAKDGQIVDATLIPVPKQRNTHQEKQTIKQGEVPAEWQEQPHKLAQKDVDARWTKQNGVSHYGYKNHSGAQHWISAVSNSVGAQKSGVQPEAVCLFRNSTG
jgi:IS5 family transposase